MTTSLPLKWHGGKHYLAPKIVDLMPRHLHYVEPYFGGGAVLFAKPCEGVSEVVNDIDGDLTNFWKVLQDEHQFSMLARRLDGTPFSESEWEDYQDVLAGRSQDPPHVRAAAFFVRYRQSRQGLGKDFATLSRNRTRRSMNEQVSAWLSAVEGLPEAHERLQRVVILDHDALGVIRQQNGPKTHFYIDPPYLHETRTATSCYRHEMTYEQHQELVLLLSHIQGTFQLSGYRNKLYDSFARRHNWRRVEFNLPNNASGKKQKERMTECLWLNYDPP